MATKTPTIALLSALSLATFGLTACDKSGAGTNAPGGYGEIGISLPDLDDNDYVLVSKTENDIHLLAFWAIWCVPCTAELAKMKGMYERLHDKGLNLYAVSIDGPDTIARVPGFASQEGWEFPVLYDSDTDVMGRYNPKGDIPFYVVLEADGSIWFSHQGYVKGDVIELEKKLTERLVGSASAAEPESDDAVDSSAEAPDDEAAPADDEAAE